MRVFTFDKSVFRSLSFNEADNANIFDMDVTYADRLRQAYYLISQAYGFSITNPPRLDRSYFSCRKMNEGDGERRLANEALKFPIP